MMLEQKQRLLIIGARGFIGQRLAAVAEVNFEVILADLTEPARANEIKMDITDPASVRDGFAAARPRIAVLLAAIADIDQCERQPELARAVNVDGAMHVAGQCAIAGARLIFISTAAVYDGSRHGYAEEDPPTPLSVYGRSKAQAEIEVKAILPAAIFLRPALVLGFSNASQTNAMLNRLSGSLRVGEIVRVPDYEYRNPIDADTACIAIQRLAELDQACGIYHIGATDSISRFELVCRLADKMGFSRALVEAQREPLPGRAPRGFDHFLLTHRLRQATGIEMPTCDQVLERCLHATA